MSIRSLSDLRNENGPDQKLTSSFAGGERSGLAIENPANTPNGEFHTATHGAAPEGARRIELYRNGFTVDGGAFRPLGIAENDKFLEELKSGVAPSELNLGVGPVHVGLVDRRAEDYQLPVQQAALFGGHGQALTATPTESRGAGDVNTERGQIQLNEQLATTSLSFRFYNGARTRRTFNEIHTIGDIHNYVMEVAPVDGHYQLLYGYPPKELTNDPNTTLKDAGLLNESIVQRLK